MNFRGSIFSRLLLLSGIIVVVSASIPSALFFRELDRQLLEKARQNLAAESRLQEQALRSSLLRTRDTLLFLSQTPPIQGIARASRSGGVDPLDGSSLKQWKQRLSSIFLRLSQSHSSYLQVRYIGVADRGRELVRVDRPTTLVEPETVVGNNLQAKGDRDYFKEAAALRPGEVIFSQIEYNREHQRVSLPPTPVLRASTPIFDQTGQLFGILVINLDARAFCEELDPLRTDREHLSAYFSPDHLVLFQSQPDSHGLNFEDQEELVRLGVKSTTQAQSTNVVETPEGTALVHYRRFNLEPRFPERVLELAAFQQLDTVYEVSREVRKKLAALLIGLLAAVLVAAYWVSQRISQPITRVTRAASRFRLGKPLRLPRVNGGEAAEIAEALQAMACRVEKQAGELRREAEYRKEKEQELTLINQALERSNADLEQFTHIASHDLQAPLRTIVSFSQILRDQLADGLTPEQQEYFGYLMRGGRRMSALLHDLREYAKLEGQSRAFQPVALEKVLQEVIHDLTAQRENCRATISGHDLPEVHGDRTQLRQLLQNLISNALRYGDKERPNEIGITVVEADTSWTISVTDTGVGIEPHQQKRIFGLFERLSNDEEGTGIGLAIAHRIVQNHGGEIWVDSTPGVGSSFRFTLPKGPVSPLNQDL